MLERLDQINWAKLHHSNGDTAGDVPVLIRSLLSKDERERDIAFQKLLHHIWHDGSIWEVTPYEVSFFWELLKSSETPNKLFIVNLLTVLAREENAHPNVMANGLDQRKDLALVEKVERYCREVHSEIAKEFHLLYPYLFCEEPLIRDYVAKAFEIYPEFKPETLPLLEKALASESDEFARKTMLNSIKVLRENFS